MNTRIITAWFERFNDFYTIVHYIRLTWGVIFLFRQILFHVCLKICENILHSSSILHNTLLNERLCVKTSKRGLLYIQPIHYCHPVDQKTTRKQSHTGVEFLCAFYSCDKHKKYWIYTWNMESSSVAGITCMQHPGEVFGNRTVLIRDWSHQHPCTNHSSKCRTNSLQINK